MQYKFLEFFAGVGMVRLGLGKNWKCIWANDISSKKAEIYCANHGSEHFFLGDISKMKNIPSDADMAWASFPCQDLSLAGWRKGMTARRSGTYWSFWEHMSKMMFRGNRPPMIVLENVVGLIHNPDFISLCESLLALDMQFGALVIDAVHFIPQSRPRVFIVAIDRQVDVEDFVVTDPSKSIWFPEFLRAFKTSLPEHIQDAWRWWKLPVPSARVLPIEDIIEREPTGVSWNSDEETQRLLAMMTERNRAKINKALLEGGFRVGFLYKRVRKGIQRAEVRFDGVAGCLRTPRGGSSRQTVVIVENGRVRTRLLSPREAARLMGVPDDFWLPDSYNQAYEAMGDGVVVPVVAWLSEQLLLPLQRKISEYGDVVRGGQDTIHNNVIASSHRVAERIAEQWRMREYEEVRC
ncbi:MAG: hypothetical protein BAA01_06570 [Bacillus thermozeamaize]|uniref:DNA (cytosine-5-)-methyltransferase n=1 Tax=Bacillus thermozeamaize TaxID=230954 RepID=A0A1Y3PJK4_9BACI|nr:MAG: hypothetical protein BAA01_06570 [Bacillus thermozeamaize]